MEEISEILRESRINAGIELAEVSKDLGISEIILTNIEEGKIGSFKDIFLLKDYISNYAKYLGLNSEKLLEEFNEYLFEYTSKIPVKEIEKTIELKGKENVEKIFSPYTHPQPKNKKYYYVMIYILILLLVVLAVFWSINQIAANQIAYISYRK